MDDSRGTKAVHISSRLMTASYGAQFVDEEDIDAVCAVLRGTNLTCGTLVDQFEEKLANIVKARYAITCSNGTTALHLASIVAGIKPGDYVIVPSITFLATANAPRTCGANILFCDVDPNSGLIEESHVIDAIKRSPQKPVALYPVDLAGQPACTAAIRKLCQEYDIKIIEDACHALGTTFVADNLKSAVGDNAYADLTIFSFHPVKNITTGEGGAVTTNDSILYEKMKCLRSHGMIRGSRHFNNVDLAFDDAHTINPWYYEMQEIGYNYRLTDIQAALGISQLNKLENFKGIRRSLKSAYDQILEPYKECIAPIRAVQNADPCWHLYTVLIDFEKLGVSRAFIMKALSERKIGSQVHYIPVHLQPYYSQHGFASELPGAMSYYAKTLSLPLHVHLNTEDIKYITRNLLEVLGLQ